MKTNLGFYMYLEQFYIFLETVRIVWFVLGRLEEYEHAPISEKLVGQCFKKVFIATIITII